MFSVFFEWIANLINGKKVDKNKNHTNIKDNNEIPPVKEENIIDRKANLSNGILNIIKTTYVGSNIDTSLKAIIIWIDDYLFYDILVQTGFQEEITTTIYNVYGLSFSSIEIKNGEHPNNATKILNGCFLLAIKSGAKEIIKEAIISAVEGHGSILNGSVLLDVQEITKLPNSRYNIGAGANPKTADNIYRTNQIAIDDSATSPEYENNKYVSRAHAHISYNKDLGFMLYAEIGGTRASQKRTHIHRGDEKIELNDTIVPVQLQDGDCIVLSKHVYLLFRKK